MVRCMLRNVPSFLWGKAINITIYTLDRFLVKAVKGKIMYEECMRNKPNIFYLKVFGCYAYDFIISKKINKLQKRYEKCIFMGYYSQHRGYKLYSPSSKAVFISRDVKFNEIHKEYIFYKYLDDLDDSYTRPNWLDVNVDKSP